MKAKERQVLTLRFNRLMKCRVTINTQTRLRLELMHGGPRFNSASDHFATPISHDQERAVEEIRRVWRLLHPDECRSTQHDR